MIVFSLDNPVCKLRKLIVKNGNQQSLLFSALYHYLCYEHTGLLKRRSWVNNAKEIKAYLLLVMLGLQGSSII